VGIAIGKVPFSLLLTPGKEAEIDGGGMTPFLKFRGGVFLDELAWDALPLAK
jgi:hypothetical protein